MLRDSRASLSPFDEISIPVRVRNQKILSSIANCSLEAKIKATYYDPYSIKGQSFYETSGLVYRTKDCLILSFSPRHPGYHVAKIYCDGSEFGPAIKFTVNSEGKAVVGEGQSRPPSTHYGTIGGRGVVTSTSSYSNATSGASSTSSYGTVGHVQSAILMPQYGPQPAFTMNYLAPHVAAVTDPLEGLNDAERIQQQKRDANALTFSELYKLKRVGVEDSYMEPSKRAAVESTMKNGMVTSETLKLLQEEAKMISNPRGARKRCQVCKQQHKPHKFMRIWETDFCLLCVKLTFMQHSFIEHFMVPTVQDCTLTVPADKKGKKMMTVQRRLPVVNLRGLSPEEVRYAQEEFKKFDIEDMHWIDKAVLLPLVKAVFAYSLKEQEIKAFLSSSTLRAMLVNMGIELRDHVHEIEFLAIVAFVAREVQMSIPSRNPYTQFTPQDLEMAFAFQVKYGSGNIGDQIQGLKQDKESNPPQNKKSPEKRDSSLSHKLPTSESFEWSHTPSNSPPKPTKTTPHGTTPTKTTPHGTTPPHSKPTPAKPKKSSPNKPSKHDRPKSGSPIYEAIPERSNETDTPPAVQRDSEDSPTKNPILPQRTSVSFFKKGVKKTDNAGRLAPIGGVTKTNPLHETGTNSKPNSTEDQGETTPKIELEDLNIPLKGMDDLGLTGSPADGWMLY